MIMFKSFGLLVGFCLVAASANPLTETRSYGKNFDSSKPGKIIIDTDAGSDDATAILLAIAAEKQDDSEGLEVIAITCTYGNTNLKNVESNVLKTLTIADRSDIPVYSGADKPLMHNGTSDNYFGTDGFGDFVFDEEIIGEIDRSKHASLALVELAKQHAGDISILALGPLTNVALAMKLDPNFVHNLKRFYIMGASVHGLGNVAPGVEFNFFQDPESNFIVLNNTMNNAAVLLPWETVISKAMPMEWRTGVLGIIDSRIVKFMNQVEGKILGSNATWTCADSMTAAVVLWPELITRTVVTNVSPVFDGAARGSVLVDYKNSTGKPQNVVIIEDFDVKGFQKILLKVFAN